MGTYENLKEVTKESKEAFAGQMLHVYKDCSCFRTERKLPENMSGI